MIKFSASFLIVTLINNFAIAQQDSLKPYDRAQVFVQQGDFDNAELTLNRALQQTPDNLDLLRMLTTTYYLERNYAKALEVGSKIVERADADVVSYQIMGLTYRSIADYKSCEELYNKALEKFPNSGLIYYEYGDLVKKKKYKKAIELWEKGIKVDPNYSGNYLKASMYYANNNNWIWAIIYGETFINIESFTDRTVEAKEMLLDGYKNIFLEISRNNSFIENSNEKNEFAKSILLLLSKQISLTSNGITPETLTTIRTNFINDWYAQGYVKRFPCFTLEYMKMLIQANIFEAYNQWVFGTAANEANYKTWIDLHSKENDMLIKFQRSQTLKLPQGQYYK